MKLSVIVPVFNAEKYLKECIESILTQTFCDFELILVDDGSTDNSAKICDEYKQKDNRVVVIHKKNEGVVCARKTGVFVAKGAYITFVDSDDFISKDAYKKSFEIIEKENPCVLCFGISDFCNGKIEALPFCNKGDLYINFSNYPTYMHAIWNKIFKKELFLQNDLEWGEGIKTTEDLLICFQLLHFAKKIIYIDENFYFYRKHDASETQQNISANRILDNTKVSFLLYDFCKKKWISKKSKKIFIHF